MPAWLYQASPWPRSSSMLHMYHAVIPVASLSGCQIWLDWHCVSLQELADSSGCYTAVPSQSTVDFMSKQRSDGLQYRVGIHHVRPSQHPSLSFWSLIYKACQGVINRMVHTPACHRVSGLGGAQMRGPDTNGGAIPEEEQFPSPSSRPAVRTTVHAQVRAGRCPECAQCSLREDTPTAAHHR